MSNQNKSVVARDYRRRYGSDMATLKLARIMYADNPLMFKDVDAARRILRYIEGKTGKEDLRTLGDRSLVQDQPRPYNPYNLPETDESKWEPYMLDASRVLLLSDIHIPYHNIPALTLALQWGAERDPDCILLNGDTIDAHGLSRFVRDPNARNFAAELVAFRQFFEVLRKEFPRAKIVFKVGNHEERYEQFLKMKAGELNGIEEFELANIIRARAEGIEVVSDKRIIKAGDLNVIHGHEFGSSFFSPVNVARGLFLRAKVSAIQGHNHATSEHTESNMNGQVTTTWSTGCLCEMHPAYLPINKWNHGFAFVEIEKDGDFHVQNKRIIKGEVF